MPPPTSAKQFHSTLGHIWYYHMFIRRYENITVPLENLMKKAETCHWNPKCDKSFNILKENLSTMSIMIFPNWEDEFHIHVDASGISLGVIYLFCETEVVTRKEQLHNDRKGGFIYDLCFAEI
jgi:hypothetical protein